MFVKSKTRTYVKIKTKLEWEEYLNFKDRYGKPEMCKLRGGTNRLFIEKGRYLKLEVEKRICPFCERREVEDETHFLLHCTRNNDLRDEFFREFSNLTHTKKED